jgi:hypothetical protein
MARTPKPVAGTPAAPRRSSSGNHVQKERMCVRESERERETMRDNEREGIGTPAAPRRSSSSIYIYT